jgi:hypothetical protein
VPARSRIRCCNDFIGDVSPTLEAARREDTEFTRTAQWAGDEQSGARYLMRSKTPKIGMYIAMIIEPMMDPMTTIMIGSMRLVSWSVVASTS